jgi:hypothetical protein
MAKYNEVELFDTMNCAAQVEAGGANVRGGCPDEAEVIRQTKLPTG